MKKLLCILLSAAFIITVLPMTVLPASADVVENTVKKAAIVDDEYVYGDINYDGEVNVSDFFEMKSVLLGAEPANLNTSAYVSYDLDFNSSLTVSDLMSMKSALISGSDEEHSLTYYYVTRDVYLSEFLPTLDETVLINNPNYTTKRISWLRDEVQTKVTEYLYTDGSSETEYGTWTDLTIYSDINILRHFLQINGVCADGDLEYVAMIEAYTYTEKTIYKLWIKINGEDWFITRDDELSSLSSGTEYRIYSKEEYLSKFDTGVATLVINGVECADLGADVYMDEIYGAIPVIAVFEKLGMPVTWNEDHSVATIELPEITINVDVVSGIYGAVYDAETGKYWPQLWGGYGPGYYGKYNGDYYVADSYMYYMLHYNFGSVCDVEVDSINDIIYITTEE